MVCTRVALSCLLEIGGKVLGTDSIMFNLVRFDIILGILAGEDLIPW